MSYLSIGYIATIVVTIVVVIITTVFFVLRYVVWQKKIPIPTVTVSPTITPIPSTSILPINSTFTEQELLIGTGGVTPMGDAQSVAISRDGTLMVVGVPSYNNYMGAIWTFMRHDTSWVQLGSVFEPEEDNGGFGYDVSLSENGSVLAVSAIGSDNDHTGSVSIYTLVNHVWTRDIFLKGVDSSQFGYSVALDAAGTTLIVGAPSSSSGFCDVYVNNNTTWVQQGSSLSPGYTTDAIAFGTSVAISYDGNTVAISAPRSEPSGDDAKGRVYIFNRDTNNNWIMNNASLTGIVGYGYGTDICLAKNGTMLAVGCPAADSTAGLVLIYNLIDSVWTEYSSAIVPSNPIGPSFFGAAVSLDEDGQTLAVGGPTDNRDEAHKVSVGATWIFRLGSEWTQSEKLISTLGNTWVFQGESVALSSEGAYLAVGSSGSVTIWYHSLS